MDETSSACLIKRVCARGTDYLIWGIATALALSFDPERFRSPTGLYYLSFCLYPFAEAFALYRFGTTIGKKMYGVSVMSVNERLSFRAALIRSLAVFVYGFGLFLPFVSLIAPVVCLFVYARRRTMPWDVRAGTAAIEKPVSRRIVFFRVCFYLFVLFGYISTIRLIWSQTLDPEAPERTVMRTYDTVLRPALLDTLTVEASFSSDARDEAVKRLDFLKNILLSERNAFLRKTEETEKKTAFLPVKRIREDYLSRLKERKKRTDTFFFREIVRIDLMKKALENLRFAGVEIRDGAPVFRDGESERLYKAYLDALETFFAVQDQENVTRP